MRFNVNMGHTLSGGDTGASSKINGVNYVEQLMTRELGNLLVEELKSRGHSVNISKCDYATTLSQSLNEQVNKCNAFPADLNICLHFNASNGNGNGSEIFTYKGNVEPTAVRVLENLAQLGLKNRGIKQSELALINNTNANTIYIEVLFLDSQKDIDILIKYGYKTIARAIACGVLGESFKVGDTVKQRRNCVVYAKGTEDIYPANILRWGLEDCICVDHTQYKKGMGKSVYSVGGLTGIEANVYLRGKDRWETLHKVLDRINRR